ncbi:MAG: hypothetical protein H6553_05655 [Chitinophagales bacterium]|nr:hypothetical protein [Chitinophagales bacterium]
MKNTILILVIIATIVSCTKENNTTNTTPLPTPRDLKIRSNDVLDTVRQIFYIDVPNQIAETQGLIDEYGSSMFSMTAIFITALQRYQTNKSIGIKDVIACCHTTLLINSSSADSYNGYDLTSGGKSTLSTQISSYPKTPYIYMKGATPSNNYTPTLPITIEMYADPINTTTTYAKIFIYTQGADSPRPLHLKKENGIWKVSNFSSLLTGYR